jgi:hypothetical protein
LSLKLLTDFIQQLTQKRDTQLDEYLVAIAQNASFINFEDIKQKHPELLEILFNQSVDGGKE